jgi:hypothetical protein
MTLVFLSGTVAGGFVHRFYTLSTVKAESAPKEYRRKYIEEMTARLHLTHDQVGKVDTVLDATRARFRQVWERSKPELDAIQADQVRQINELLDEKQQAEYGKLRAEREKRRKAGSPF